MGMMEVRFDQYCHLCKYEDTKEIQDPCNDCLDEPARFDSERPLYYEVKKNEQKHDEGTSGDSEGDEGSVQGES